MKLEETRSLEQNDKFHAMCRDLAKQVQWAGQWLDEEQWKRLVLGAAHGQLVVPNPFGGDLVVVNKTTSRKLKKPSMAELIEQMYAFGAEQGVKWTDERP